jgi:phage terminase small subunit
MPVLDNAKHERFAQELAKGQTLTEAYRLAGYTESRPHASRLATRGNIRQRVRELQRPAIKAAQVTLESLLDELEEARALAIALKQPGAAVAAVREKSVLSGHRVEKSERRVTTDARQLTDAELDAAIAAAVAREEAAQPGPGLAH